MKLAEKFVKMKSEEKDFFILLAIAIIVFLCLTPLFFLSKGSWPLGWLLGSAVSLFAYWSIIKFTSSILSSDNTKKASTIFGVVAGGARIFLYAAALIVSAICTFKSQWFGGFSAFNFFSTFIAFMPMPLVLIISNLIRNKKPVAKPIDKPADQEGKEE
jgi:predicted ABC-type exoprotein transport system permease subunit